MFSLLVDSIGLCRNGINKYGVKLVCRTNRRKTPMRVYINNAIKDGNLRTYRVGIAQMIVVAGFITIVRITSYQIAYQTSFLSTEEKDVLKTRSLIFCGVIGCLSEVLMNPIKFIKCNLMTWESCRSSAYEQELREITFRKHAKALRTIYGWRIFLVGWKACVYRGFIAAVAQLVTFEMVQRRIYEHFQNEVTDARSVPIIAAIASAVISSLLACPFVEIRDRLHYQQYTVHVKTLRGLRYADFTDAYRKMYQWGGIPAFYMGLRGVLAKDGTSSMISMMFWHHWKEDIAEMFKHQDSIAFVEQKLVEVCFDFMDM